MSKVKAKIDCCGSNFETDHVSFIGLVTFSFPMIVLFILILPLLGFSSLISKWLDSLYQNVKVLLVANFKLIHKQSLAPDLRCSISAKAIRISAGLSNAIYDYFNLFLVSFPWLLFIIGVSIIVWS